MATQLTESPVITMGIGVGQTSATYTMQEGNWKIIDVWGRVTTAGSVAVAATVTLKKNTSITIAPFGAGVMYAPNAAGTAVAALQKNSALGTVFRPSLFTSSSTAPVLAQGDVLTLASDTAGAIEVYVKLARV
jgi:hypothetical protein